MVGMRAAAGVLALGVVAAACSGGDVVDGGGDASSVEGREYVEALAATIDEDFVGNLSEDEQECVARAMVDAVGLAGLQAAVTPDEIRENPEDGLTDLGVEVNEEQAEAFWDDLNDCIDVSEVLAAAAAESLARELEDPDVSDQAVTCFEEEFDEDFLKPMVVTAMVEGEEALEDEEFASGLVDVVAACVDLREFIVSGWAEEEDLSDEAVACLEAELDEDFLKQLAAKSMGGGEEALVEDEEFVGELFDVVAACPEAFPDLGG